MSANVINEVNAPVTAANSAINQTNAIARGSRAKGEALASLLNEELEKQAGVLKRYIVSLLELDKDGRAGFLAYTKKITQERAAYVKENGGKGSLNDGVNKSAGVRLSEFKKLAEAIDKGFVPNMEHGYHAIVAAARLFAGKDTRGRAKTSALIKAINFLKKVEMLEGEEQAIKALMETAVKLAESMGLAESGEDAPF